MDDRRFDALARALGGAATRRSALGALAGLLAGGTALQADARKKREKNDGPQAAGKRRNKKRCKPACTGNFSCIKGQCVCEQVLCGTACCDTGQVCQRGRCVGQGTVFCHDLQETCGDGTPCCDGLMCGSGYGGAPVACYPVEGGECIANEECAYGFHCENDICVVDPPPPPAPDNGGGDDGGGGGGGTTCGVVAVTSNAGANGKALQDAVAAARDGETLKLAAGEYRFDNPSGVETVIDKSGIGVENKTLTIEPCEAGAVITLVCPERASTRWACVLAKGLTGSAALTLRGVTVDLRSATGIGYGILAAEQASIVLEDVAVQVASDSCFGISALANNTRNATIDIKGGVSVNSTAALSNQPGLRQELIQSTIACDAAVVFEGAFASNRCINMTGQEATDCGCTP